jgi:hypothetical protein
MEDQLTRVATFVRDRSPSVLCPPCIATDLGITEQHVRERLQVIVARPDLQKHFALTRRPCNGCG